MTVRIIDLCVISSFIWHKGGGGCVALRHSCLQLCLPSVARAPDPRSEVCVFWSSLRLLCVAKRRPIAISDPLSCVRCADAVVRASARHATPSVARRSTIVSTYFHAKATVCRYPGGGWWRRRRLLVDSACASRSDASSDSKYLLSR